MIGVDNPDTREAPCVWRRGTVGPPWHRGHRVGTPADGEHMSIIENAPRLRQQPLDHGLADGLGEVGFDSEYACLVCVTHVTEADAWKLRLIPGVTGVIECETTAEVHLIVGAATPRAARRECVERVSERLPQAVVTVPEVVDYNCALLSFLERHGELEDDWATFSDEAVVAEVLDRA